MKTKITTILSLVLFVCFVANAYAERQLKVDTEQSLLRWTGKKVTGAHHGSVKILEGAITVNGSEIVSGKFKIDMPSIVVEDIKDPKYNKKLTNHLKSNDFFDATNFPCSEFEIVSATKLSSEGPNGENYDINGNLTIVGIRHELRFPAKVALGEESSSAFAKIEVDRTKYNIRYGSGKFFENLGDKLINDHFEIELSIVAK